MCATAAVEYIESKAYQEKGLTIYESKFKYLHDRWFSKPNKVTGDDKNNKDDEMGSFGSR